MDILVEILHSLYLDVSGLTALPSKFTRSASLCGDSPPNFSQFYEVLFLGKIKSSHKRAPPTFIDDALKKFKQKGVKVLEDKAKDDTSNNRQKQALPVAHPLDIQTIVTPNKDYQEDKSTKCTDSNSSAMNRTMLLQIGRSDLRLISPDTKQVLLHKSFREISHCACGQENLDHFGFICRDVGEKSHYVGYIFRCDSVSVVDDIMTGLKSAFQNAHEQNKKDNAEKRCSQCPIFWYNHLAEEVNGVSVSKAQGIILKSLEKLEAKEKEEVLSKMQGAETTDIAEQNQILMLLLKALCEVQQESHQHGGQPLDIAGDREDVTKTDLNMMEAVRSAKRSLAESFNGIIRRRPSVDTLLSPGESAVGSVTNNTAHSGSQESK